MIPTLTNASSSTPQSAATQPTSTQSAGSASDPLVTEQTFLQLLVAQLENQDPMDPQDGTQFVTELAQFSSVEQQVQMRTDLDSINSILTTEENQQQAASGQSGQTALPAHHSPKEISCPHFRPPYQRFPHIAPRLMLLGTTWRT
jgi:flagellar basal-body rod modification protein FlgD